MIILLLIPIHFFLDKFVLSSKIANTSDTNLNNITGVIS